MSNFGWKRKAHRRQGLDKVILTPPIEHEYGCRSCELRQNDQCRLTAVGNLPCEGLTLRDLIVAQHHDELEQVVWWLSHDELIDELEELGVLNGTERGSDTSA